MSNSLRRLRSAIAGLNDYKQIANQPVIFTNPVPTTANGGPSLNQTLKNVRVPIDDEGNLLAVPVFNFGANGNMAIGTIRASNGPTGQAMGTDNTTSTTGIIYIYNGTTYDVLEAGSNVDTGVQTGIAAVYNSVLDSLRAQSVGELAVAGINASLSAIHTANAISIDIRNLHSQLSINATASAGTFTLALDFSVDNSTWITGYSMAANAGPQRMSFVGAAPISSTTAIAATDVSNPIVSGGALTETTVLNPLSFRYLRITAGDAGVGNTTTTTVTVK